ncbi:hypothetical protein D9M72_363950 [compost metagenome]
MADEVKTSDIGRTGKSRNYFFAYCHIIDAPFWLEQYGIIVGYCTVFKADQDDFSLNVSGSRNNFSSNGNIALEF